MKLKIEYVQVANCINVLDKLSLKGLKSIHRTRLAKELSEKLTRIVEEQKEIQKEYYELDEDGNPIIEDKKCKDKEEYLKTMGEFTKEKIVIDSGDSQVILKSIKQSLEESEVEWNGRESYAFEYLYSALSDEKDAKKKEAETETE
ncbi:hypothetical protein CIL05_06855 [Virgibacillus profundi]|uniref:DUF1617 domain-containing protein n=1 Tax=Virgibacillus profundi TaxID=2024555 RepID=A0A2A2IDV3_9BACI|nr:hypothetical protein [Virgibacillus profundi]PAV30181.1 hypothetical protein CIL05_06855 [Virgibacillus profundi]PXY54353.1 hypothetical protein CIT14_06940 [Virgibacillus profundi]